MRNAPVSSQSVRNRDRVKVGSLILTDKKAGEEAAVGTVVEMRYRVKYETGETEWIDFNTRRAWLVEEVEEEEDDVSMT